MGSLISVLVSCLTYSECFSNRAFYDVCWSSECNQCSEETVGIRNTQTGCSGKYDSNDCGCSDNLYTETPCYSSLNEIEEPDVGSCWIKICEDSNCWVRVPVVCNTCRESWLGVTVGSDRKLKEEDISNKPEKECSYRNIRQTSGSADRCTQKILKESEHLSCDSNCSCSKKSANTSLEDTTCKRLLVEISSACNCERNKQKQKDIFEVVSNCCNCNKVNKLSGTTNNTTGSYTPTTRSSLKTKSSSTTSSSTTSSSTKSSSTSPGTYGY